MLQLEVEAAQHYERLKSRHPFSLLHAAHCHEIVHPVIIKTRSQLSVLYCIQGGDIARMLCNYI